MAMQNVNLAIPLRSWRGRNGGGYGALVAGNPDDLGILLDEDFNRAHRHGFKANLVG